MSAAVIAGPASRPALIGRISEVNDDSSKVLLLTDAISAISVTVERTGDIGLLEGRNNPYVALNYLPQKSGVMAGDTVVTVGRGGVFPPGVPVGEVVSVANSEDGFFREARVRPAINVGDVREVLVVQRRQLPAPIVPAAKTPVPAHDGAPAKASGDLPKPAAPVPAAGVKP
jgi:rod shape-determining protein MreC